jgi:hypothetical protein
MATIAALDARRALMVVASLCVTLGVARAQGGPPPPPQDEDHGRPVALVARELGVTPEQFRAAFRKVRPAGPGQEPTEAQRRANRKVLAEGLGVSPERLDAVMDKYRPGGRGTNGQFRPGGGDGPPPPRMGGPNGGDGDGGPPPFGPPPDGGHRPPPPPVDLIARDLGLPQEKVRSAFQKVGPPSSPGQPPTDAQRQAHRKALAASLGVSPERLDAVMERYRPRRGPGGGPDGPGGDGPRPQRPPRSE